MRKSKYIKPFEKFRYNKLILESEIKYSKELYDEIIHLYTETFHDFHMAINKDKQIVIEKNTQSLSPRVMNFLYDSFKIKIGAVFLQLCANKDWRLDDDIRNEINKILISKSIDNNKLSDCQMNFTFKPFYEKENKKGLFYGSLSISKEFEFIKDSIFNSTIKLNLFEKDDIPDVVRHELQHLTQYINSFCLMIGNEIIKNRFHINDIRELVSKIWTKSIENLKVGHGKTKLGVKQDWQSKESDTEKSRKYLIDDSEYKIRLNDMSKNWVRSWIRDNKKFEELFFYYSLQKQNIDKRELIKISKEMNLPISKLISNIKSFNFEDIAISIFRKNKSLFLLDEIKITRDAHPEYDRDLINLLKVNIQNEFESRFSIIDY